MINFLKKRKLRKQLKEYLHAARHARHMREDIANPQDLEELIAAEAVVAEIRKTGQGDVETAVKRLSSAADKVYPTVNTSGMRENVEVVIVALAAAMAIRAFFFQPFKIPTGSMQPTLNGIIATHQTGATWNERPPIKFLNWLILGESYKVIRAKSSGYLTQSGGTRDVKVYSINGVRHKIPEYMRSLTKFSLERVYKKGEVLVPGPKGKEIRVLADGRIERTVLDAGQNGVVFIGGIPHHIPAYLIEPVVGKHYEKGEIILAGKVVTGDHILVNKMKYNFMSPQRGDIAVFDTKHIVHPQVRKDTFYIKRMIGLPNEKIQVQNREIVVNGKILRDPPIFEKMVTDPAYKGHTNPFDSRLPTANDFIQLGPDQYLMMGDNTENSLDGRFFGGVPRKDFQGPAFFVYWPFRSHWGTIQ